MLRDYQTQVVNSVRSVLRDKRSVVIQMPTGSGKTAVVSDITKRVFQNNKRAWFIVPRRELVKQSSKSFKKWDIPHGIIDASHSESRAYKVHVISLQTLMRRLGKIKEYPDIVFIDECHLFYDTQVRIFAALSKTVKIIGLTATPGRLDGRGLGTLYDDIIYGASITFLTSRGYLSPLRYYAPPTDGIQLLKFRSTGEVNQDELDKLLTERAIYGRAVDYYTRLACLSDGTYRRGVGFCSGVKAAEKQAAEFRARGFVAECISGDTPEKKQRALLDGLASGRVQVLCSADLLLYGWDSPKVSYGFLLRRTKSKALFFQIVGRILRPSENKTDAIFVDHTANVDLHTDPAYPGIPPFYLDRIDWNFHGNNNKQPAGYRPDVRLCHYDNFMVCTKSIRCPQCEKYVPLDKIENVIDSIPLKERIMQMAPNVVTSAEKREYQDAIAECVREAQAADDDANYDRAVAKLCDIAKKLNYSWQWVYKVITGYKYIIDDRALRAIQKARNYKEGWVYITKKVLREQMEGASA